jgi:hypothetical protein
MTNKFLSTLAVLCAVGLSACKSVEVDNTGAIAGDYATAMNSFDGTYGGTLLISYSSNANKASQLLSKNFKLNLDTVGKRPTLTSNLDILGAGCGSSIGKLVSLEVGGAWDFVARFAFDAGNCADRVDADYVVVFGNEKKALFTLKKDRYQNQLPGRSANVTVEYRSSLKKL